ncbi:MAG: hypothetical protein K2J85_02930 [Anaeroplasmataceae bacterium]|nr:hypothetical protein [Anaeroplasmataceae bacterium]
MKKIRYLILFLIAFITIGYVAACTTATPKDKVQMTGIEAVDTEGNPITEDIEYQTKDASYSHKNVKVLATYSDESVQEVTLFAQFTEMTLSQLGEFEIKVTVNDFETSYKLKVLENSLDHIEITYEEAKLSYKVGDYFNPSSLVVYDCYKNGERHETNDYTISILDLAGNEISKDIPFGAVGEYKVEIIHQSLKASYGISVDKKASNFSSIRFDTSNVDTVYLGSPFSSSKLRAYGITGDSQEKEISLMDIEAQLYYQNQAVASFNALGEYEVRLSYKGECSGTKTASYTVLYSPYASLEIASDKTVYENNEALDYAQIKVYGKTDVKEEELSSDLYQFTLVYEDEIVTKFDEDGFYEIKVGYKNPKFKYEASLGILYLNAPLTEELASIDTDKIVQEASIYSDAFSFSLADFIAATPSGFLLSGVRVEDEQGNLVVDLEYDGIATNLVVSGLESNHRYVIKPYYDLALTTYGLRQDITPGYRIHFVGFVILTSSTIAQTHKVRLMYEGKVLYTVLVADNQDVPEGLLISFMLPIQYESYHCIGTEHPSDLRNIQSDKDIELVLISSNETSIFSVVFYDYDRNIVKIEKVTKNSSATAPTIDAEIKTSSGKTLSFTGWNSDFTNVTRTLSVYPIYTDLLDIVPQFSLKAYVGKTSALLDISLKNYSNCKAYLNEFEVNFIAPDNTKQSLEKVDKRFNVTLKYAQKNLLPDTTYIVEIVSSYTYEGSTKTTTQLFDFATLPADMSSGVTLSLVSATYQSIKVKSDKKTISGVFCLVDEENLTYNLSTLSSDGTANLVNLKHLSLYSIGSYMYSTNDDKTKSIYLLFEDELQVETEDATPPTLPQNIYVLMGKYSCEIYIPKNEYPASKGLDLYSEAVVYYPEFGQMMREPIFLDVVSEQDGYCILTISIVQRVPENPEEYYEGFLSSIDFRYFFDEQVEISYKDSGKKTKINGYDVAIYESDAK